MITFMNIAVESLAGLSTVTKSFVPLLSSGGICLLKGPMASGKTTFVSSFMAHFDFFGVSSPSFSLVQEYESSISVFHMDLYRLESYDELELLDLEHYFKQKTHLIFIEWAEKLGDFHYPYCEILFKKCGGETRELEFNDFRNV
ncbi:tRNA (adenosine(37)-N6)-threonylcarbamoyltransferase complex ATPase subunit type 1 TsaE [Candidatus Marinamargulisbacteria bacterium SCGC AG-343-D04]|nr:tRNA (adenosine(37)-N6)-threonylcarbamoyltransferase complex ATPase subunit type 1 TsaE [Candidatus Marinamargulisbacteria bacterium SCGC AG-343-D04]